MSKYCYAVTVAVNEPKSGKMVNQTIFSAFENSKPSNTLTFLGIRPYTHNLLVTGLDQTEAFNKEFNEKTWELHQRAMDDWRIGIPSFRESMEFTLSTSYKVRVSVTFVNNHLRVGDTPPE